MPSMEQPANQAPSAFMPKDARIIYVPPIIFPLIKERNRHNSYAYNINKAARAAKTIRKLLLLVFTVSFENWRL